MKKIARWILVRLVSRLFKSAAKCAEWHDKLKEIDRKPKATDLAKIEDYEVVE